MTMKAIIKIVTANKDFSEDEKMLFRRMVNVLFEHNLSARVMLKKKVTKTKILKLKAI
jgi:hypothetical protein